MLRSVDYKYFDKAKKVAAVSDFPKVHVGCVAVYHGQVIGLGCNCNKTHPTQKFYNQYREPSESMPPKLHAEINCINQIKHLNINFSKVRLYIYRIRNDRPIGMSRVRRVWQPFGILGLKTSTIRRMMDSPMKKWRNMILEVLLNGMRILPSGDIARSEMSKI